MHGLMAGIRLQFAISRRQPDDLIALCAIPFTAIILLSVVLHAQRPDLVVNALLAPGLMGLWNFATGLAADVLQSERWLGTFDSLVAAPSDVLPVVAGRVFAVMLFGLLPLAETFLLGWALFDQAPTIRQPGLFGLTALVTVFAMAGTSLALGAALATTRNGVVYQNFLSFPVYILSGVMVPVSYLPDFLEPLSRAVFLTWSAELLRESVTTATSEHIWPRLALIAGFGATALVCGRLVLSAVLRRARETGSVTHA